MDPNIHSRYANRSTGLEPALVENDAASTLQKHSSQPQLHLKASTGQTLLDQFSPSTATTLKDVAQLKNELLCAKTTALPALAKKMVATLFLMHESDRAKGFHEALELVAFSLAQSPYKKEITPLFCFLATLCASLPKADQPEAVEKLIFLMDRQSDRCCKNYSAENRVTSVFMLRFMEDLREKLEPEQRRELDAKLPNWRVNVHFMNFHFHSQATSQRLDDEASYRAQFESAAYAMSPVSVLAVSAEAMTSVPPSDRAST